MQRIVPGLSLLLALIIGSVVTLAGPLGDADASPPRLRYSSRSHAAPPTDDCRHRYDSIPLPEDVGTHTAEDFALPGPITNVPEYHDCQALIVDSAGRLVFREIAGVFASFRLPALITTLCAADSSLNAAVAPSTPLRGPTVRAAGRLADTLRTVSFPPAVQPPMCARERPTTGGSDLRTPRPPGMDSAAGPAIAAALVLNRGGQYRPLGMAPGFNCLYLYFDRKGDLRAKMVPVGAAEVKCLEAIPNPDTASGKPLELRFFGPSTRRADYPAVARWDWDEANREHFIGIMCGTSWCEVGDTSFVSSAAHVEPPAGVLPEVDPRWRVRYRIKGWYDEQRLAVSDPEDPARLVPSNIVGTLIPIPALDTMSVGVFQNRRWRPVAVAFLRETAGPYTQKLNLGSANPRVSINVISLCNRHKFLCVPVTQWATTQCATAPADAKPEDIGQWWVRIRSVSGETRYFCAHRRDHSHLDIHVVGTARWRWLRRDETGWMRCLEGCCEIEAES